MQRLEPVPHAVTDGAPPRLGEAIAGYATALDALASGVTDTQAGVLEMLLARDALARALASAPNPTPETLSRVAELDARLRGQAAAVAASVGSRTLAGWRSATQPPGTAWWWSLDTIADSAASASHPIWAILAGAFITLAVSLASDISLRFLSGGPDLLGLISTFSQALLAVLAGSAFTRVGGEWLTRFLSSVHAVRGSRGAWKTSFAAALLAAILVLWLSLPSVARLYNDRGVRLQQAGKVTSARQSFERAIRLSPDYAQARFNLASAHEETLDYDAALGEYQRALKLDERLYPAYNNLARLYVLRRGDPASALALLDHAIALKPPEKRVLYSLHKNRGWANLRLEYFLQAERDLKDAISLRPEGGAAAHCLLAQVFEAQKKDASVQWNNCLAYAPGEQGEVEASWLGRAQERLLQEVQ